MSGKFFARLLLYGTLWTVASLAFQAAIGFDIPWYVSAAVGGLAVIASWKGD